MTQSNRIVAIVAEQEWPAALLRIQANEDGRTFQYSVDADEPLLIICSTDPNEILTDILDFERCRPAEIWWSALRNFRSAQRHAPIRRTARERNAQLGFSAGTHKTKGMSLASVNSDLDC